jgi:NitT/TauT family transport system permease protein
MNRASVITLLGVCLLWEVVTRYLDIPRYIFPAPSIVILDVINNWDNIIRNAGITTFESLLGAVLGCVVGLSLGGLMAMNRWAKNVLLPYAIGSNAVPIVAIAPLLTLWFGHGIASKVVVAGFLCFFPIAINTYDGLRDRGGVLKDLFSVIGASSDAYFWKLRLPLSVPFLVSGAKVSVVLAVIGAVVAEFIGADAGLGFGMVQATYSLNTPRLFSYMIIACALGLTFYGLVLLLEVRLKQSRRWHWAFGLQTGE